MAFHLELAVLLLNRNFRCVNYSTVIPFGMDNACSTNYLKLAF